MVNSPDQRPIAVFTGSRAEYGLMRHLVAGIAAAPRLELQLIVSGSHLSAFHGGTLAEIEADGHEAAALVPLSLDQKPPRSMAALSAEALEGIAQALERLQPERLILLGDRYEAFAAAAAAHLLGINVGTSMAEKPLMEPLTIVCDMPSLSSAPGTSPPPSPTANASSPWGIAREGIQCGANGVGWPSEGTNLRPTDI